MARWVGTAAAAIVLALTGARAQSPEVLGVDRQIIATESRDSALMGNLEYLCDVIGPRLTGSESHRKANEWTAQKMREYGLEQVHLETYTIPSGWERVTAEAQMLEPRRETIPCASRAWSPGTRGAVTGPVVLFDARDEADYARFRGRLRNAIVLLSAPPDVQEHLMAPASGTDVFEQPRSSRARAARMEFLRKEGARVILTDSAKPQALLTTGGSWAFGPQAGGLAQLFVAHEQYAMFYRLLKRGLPVRLRVRVENRITRGPVTVYNTVGEIRGSDRPDEVVLLGAHLDSWDLGTGAVDDGTGCMTVLETARLFRTLGIRPRRTVRFVLFSGEEQGLLGSGAYAERHKAEMGKVSAVFVHDTGTGRVTGIGLHGNPQVQPVLEPALAVLKDLGVTRYTTFRMGGTDHASFSPFGVPAFWFMQESQDYNLMHHTQSDTFDKAIPEALQQGATVMAICAYNVAQLPDLLPRGAVEPAR